MTSVLRRQITLAGLLAASGCAATAPVIEERTKGRTMSQDASPKKTHCLGRYLIDLQADTKISASFVYGKGQVETKTNTSKGTFDSLVAARESALKSARHDKFGSLFVGRTELGSNKVLLDSWKSDANTESHANESFIYLPENKVLFTRKTSSDADAHARTVTLAKSIAADYKYRAPDEIPSGVGFCINFGMIADKNLNSEEVRAAFKFDPYPTVSVYFNSYVTGSPDAELLSRIGGIPASLASAAAGMSTLRKGNRNLGPVKGQELLVRASEDGKRSYEFLWESQGRPNSIEFPFLSIKLTTVAETDKKGQIVEAPFKTDEEALQFWDAIVQTLRLRPGAV